MKILDKEAGDISNLAANSCWDKFASSIIFRILSFTVRKFMGVTEIATPVFDFTKIKNNFHTAKT